MIIYKNIFLFTLILCTISCTSHTHKHYSTFIQKLDDKNELKISTFPHWYPKTISKIPFLYKKTESGEKFYFQVYIKDVMQPAGKNHNINNIMIENFSVSVGAGEKVQLIKDYEGYFWMQNNSNYDNIKASPFAYKPSDPIHFDIKFNMNAKEYSISGEMEPTSSNRVYPLIMELLR